jgi:hypothetical protein
MRDTDALREIRKFLECLPGGPVAGMPRPQALRASVAGGSSSSRDSLGGGDAATTTSDKDMFSDNVPLG